MLHGFLEFEETWNKLTNFKLNHDVANQMWSEAKLGHLLLLDPFRMLETWHAWTLIMIKLLGVALDLLVFAWNGLGLHLEGMHLVSFWPLMLIMCRHLWWTQVLGLDSFKKQIGLSFQVEFNHKLLGLSSFTTYKVQTIIIGSSVGLESSWFKQRPNTCIMQCNLHGPT